jgi:hypothetical protein
MKSILTGNPVCQRLAATLAAVGVALLLTIALPGQAQASATGCVWSQAVPRSCVKVIGSSTYVNSIAGGVNLGPRQSARGHFHVWGSGFSYYTSDATYWNQSWWHLATYWGQTFPIGRNLPNGSKVCAAFYDTRLGWRNGACETIIA